MSKKHLPHPKIAFCICLLSAFFLPRLFPLFFFAPYLATIAYQKDRIQILWRGLGCGLIMDLLSSAFPFGFFALNYSLTMWILSFLTRFLFEDRFSTLPIMAMLFSQIVTLFYPILALLFSHPFSISWQWIVADVFLISFYEFVYTLVFFSLPFYLTQRLAKLKSL